MLEHFHLHLNDKARMRQQHLGREGIRRGEGEGPQIGLALLAWALSGICCWFLSALPIFIFYFFVLHLTHPAHVWAWSTQG